MLPRLDPRNRNLGTSLIASSSRVTREVQSPPLPERLTEAPSEAKTERPLSPQSAANAYDYVVSQQPDISLPRQNSTLIAHVNPQSRSREQWGAIARSMEVMHTTAINQAAQSFKAYLTSSKTDLSTTRVQLPQIDELPASKKSRKEKELDVALMMIDIHGARKTSYFAEFLIQCTTRILDDLESLSPSSDLVPFVNRRSVKDHLRDQISFVRDTLRYMEKIGNTLEQLHYSMRTLVRSEGLARGDCEVHDYAERLEYLSPLINPIAINVMQTLEDQGSVWIPMDIRFGSPRHQEEKLHFLIVLLHKTRNGDVSFSAYETNGAFDLSKDSTPSNTADASAAKLHQVSLLHRLRLGSAFDFSFRPGTCNAYAIERLLHPANRILSKCSDLRSTFPILLKAFASMSDFPSDESHSVALFNPDQPKRACQTGDTCQFACINSALALHPDINTAARSIIQLSALDKSTQIIGEQFADIQRGALPSRIGHFGRSLRTQERSHGRPNNPATLKPGREPRWAAAALLKAAKTDDRRGNVPGWDVSLACGPKICYFS